MKKGLLIIVIIALAGIGAFAQTSQVSHSVQLNVPALSLLGLNNTSTVTLAVSLPTNAGDTPIGAADSSKYLRYTSLTSATTARRISVQWGGSDAAPAGTKLHVVAGTPGGTGTVGAAVSSGVDVSSTAQDIITGIKSCWTGTGATAGANLTYSLVVDTPASLSVGDNKTDTITFTLTDAS
jgi:hypothetical protein